MNVFPNSGKMQHDALKISVNEAVILLLVMNVAWGGHHGTYNITDKDSGRQLICDYCPPGTYRYEHCTEAHSTHCAPCPEGTFQAVRTRANRCEKCHTGCYDNNAVIISPCTDVVDLACRCPEGWFYTTQRYGYILHCFRFRICDVGFGVLKPGTEKTNVMCERCPSGFFSERKSSTEKCKAWTDCAKLAKHVIVSGTSTTDNICGSEDQAESSDGKQTPHSSAKNLSTTIMPALPSSNIYSSKYPAWASHSTSESGLHKHVQWIIIVVVMVTCITIAIGIILIVKKASSYREVPRDGGFSSKDCDSESSSVAALISNNKADRAYDNYWDQVGLYLQCIAVNKGWMSFFRDYLSPPMSEECLKIIDHDNDKHGLKEKIHAATKTWWRNNPEAGPRAIRDALQNYGLTGAAQEFATRFLTRPGEVVH